MSVVADLNLAAVIVCSFSVAATFDFFVLQEQLVAMDETTFATNRAALAMLKEEKDKTLKQETARHWIEIASRQLIFNRSTPCVSLILGCNVVRQLCSCCSACFVCWGCVLSTSPSLVFLFV